MWDESNQIVTRQLMSGETLLWSGRPRQGLIYGPMDLLAIPAAVAGIGIAWVFIQSVTGIGTWLTYLIFGAFCLQIAFYAFGRHIIDLFYRRHACYGVTNQRAIIISGIFNRRTTTVNFKYLSDFSFGENNDGSGTILFGPKPPTSTWRTQRLELFFNKRDYEEFRLIPDVRKVYEIISRAQRELQNGTRKAPTFEQIP